MSPSPSNKCPRPVQQTAASRPTNVPTHFRPVWLFMVHGRPTDAVRRVDGSTTGKLFLTNGVLPLDRDWTGRPDRSPLHFWNVLFMGSDDFIILSKCQTNRLRMPVVAPKYGLVTGKALLGRFAKYTLTGFPSVSFPFVLFFRLCVPFRRCFLTDGRNITHRKSCLFGG